MTELKPAPAKPTWTSDPDYRDRLMRHFFTLLAYEHTELAYDENAVMLALVFVRNHVDMCAAELGRFDKNGQIQG